MKPDNQTKLGNNLALLYGKNAKPTTGTLIKLVESWKPRIHKLRKFWDERDSILITYGDPIETNSEIGIPLLDRFLCNYVDNAINIIHILPFYPSTSDGGFSVINFREVSNSQGNWDDIQSVGKKYRLVFDCVINHVSKSSAYVKGHLSQSKEYENYCIEHQPSFDYSNVMRPRTSPLFHTYESKKGEVQLWTTFSEDQVDLNFSNPRVLIELMDIILFYASKGASVIRLDAIPYLWKESGTSCVHLQQTHAFIRIIRIILNEAAPHVLILSETNVPHSENLTYFGTQADEAQIIYNFSLPPLILYALTHTDTEPLTRWAKTLKSPSDRCTFLNITSTHDGIGLRPVEGILTKEQINSLVNITLSHQGHVSYKSNSDGSKSPYELNITFYDAINDPTDHKLSTKVQVLKFLVSQATAMALAGVPGIYFNSLLGLRNNQKEHEVKREINRGKVSLAEIEKNLRDPESPMYKVFHGIKSLLEKRKSESSFHPNSENTVLDLGRHIFAVWRCNRKTNEMLLALHNFSDEALVCTLPNELHHYHYTDILDPDSSIKPPNILMPAYGIRWLKITEE